jgi:hypothetical protein
VLVSLAVLLTSCGDGDPGNLSEFGSSGTQSPTPGVCNPLTFGAVADGFTDNTVAIQAAVTACAAQGHGLVELSAAGAAVYVTGPFTLKSHVHLYIDPGVTLQATNRHSRFNGAYINWVYQQNEALISAKGATDVAILGGGTIDGAADIPDPDDGGRTWHEVAAMESSANPSMRPWMIEFYQCDHVTISGVTIQHQPYWTQALRYSSEITESGVTINGVGRNSDGVDLVGATNVTLSDLSINVSDDNIAVKSGLPIRQSDPYYAKEIGLPQMPTSHVLITNISARSGQGISIGSEAVNGVHDVVIENVNFTNVSTGFRIKTARDRGGEIYDISVDHFRMSGAAWPIEVSAYYAPIGPDPRGAAQPITVTTPHLHDIYIQDFIATGATGQSYIQGLPESCIQNVTLNNVTIESSGFGIDLLHMTGSFTNVTSTSTPPFVVEENVTVTTAGTTAVIPPTPPLAGQVACNDDSSAPPSAQPIAPLPKVDKLPAYEVIGSGPLVVVLAMDMQETLHDPATTDKLVSRLLSAGYSVMSLDLPCHGADAEPGVKPLDCWAKRIAAGDKDIFLGFCSGLLGVLDALHAWDVGVVGISRGAYVAITCAAYDQRFRDLALEIPVTDLNYLTSFKSLPVDEAVFGTGQYVPHISDRAILVRIGKHDTRVGTALAEAFAREVGATLELTDAVGHEIAEDGSTITWLRAHPF